MSLVASILIASVAVAGVMVAGAYLVAVMDRWTARLVAGGGVDAGRAMAAPARDAAFLLTRHRTSTERPDARAWALAPALLAGLAALALTLVPIAPDTVIADPATGFVVFSAAIAFVMIAVFLHGWAPDSTLPLIGAYRFGAQALSFQIPFLLAVLATTLPAGSLSIVRIAEAQEPLWNVVRQPLGLPIYLVVGLAVSYWGPLDLPDGRDLAGGTSAEDAGIARLLWSGARAAMLVAIAAMGATVFLGGWYGPVLPGPVWVALKTLLLLAVIVLAGNLFARVRIGSFVIVCWTLLIPLSLLNIFVSGAILL